jgi:hypothetical protein
LQSGQAARASASARRRAAWSASRWACHARFRRRAAPHGPQAVSVPSGWVEQVVGGSSSGMPLAAADGSHSGVGGWGTSSPTSVTPTRSEGDTASDALSPPGADALSRGGGAGVSGGVSGGLSGSSSEAIPVRPRSASSAARAARSRGETIDRAASRYPLGVGVPPSQRTNFTTHLLLDVVRVAGSCPSSFPAPDANWVPHEEAPCWAELLDELPAAPDLVVIGVVVSNVSSQRARRRAWSSRAEPVVIQRVASLKQRRRLARQRRRTRLRRPAGSTTASARRRCRTGRSRRLRRPRSRRP